MAKFENKNDELYIDGKKVIKAWESFSGCFWFATEKAEERKLPNGSLIDGKVVEDTIWFGLVQGHTEEWGYFSEAELKTLGNRVWEIKKKDLPYAGRS